ncbi:MAG: hypothetical protein AAGA54_19425 [Myxococcota bacterium]
MSGSAGEGSSTTDEPNTDETSTGEPEGTSSGETTDAVQVDCEGTPEGDAVEDDCGVCNGDGSSCADCEGVPNGDAVEDECGVCNGDGSSCADCDGVPNGGAVIDACGVCGGDDSSCADCDGVPNGDAVEDECGVCNGDGTSCLDCAGVPNGDAVVDACGVCNGLGAPCWGCTTPSASNFDPLATVNDGTCVCEPVNGGISDQVNVQSNAGSGSTDQWQSFTVGLSGGLTLVDLGVGSPVNGDSPGELRFYAGEGIGGIELGSQDVIFADVFNTMQEFELDEPIPMTAGEVYTVRFTVPNITVGWVDIANFDAYDGGRGSFSPNIDFVFRTYVSQCIPE